jgi:Mycothiol maleylpyruvate isomerase N-terminal domain
MDATDVLAAAEQCAQFLASTVTADWTAPIPDMDWTVAQAVAHAAEAPLWYSFDLYSFDLTAGSAELTTLEVRVKPESAPAELVATLVTAARVLAPVIAASPPDARGVHPWGQADPSTLGVNCERSTKGVRRLQVAFHPRQETGATRWSTWTPF